MSWIRKILLGLSITLCIPILYILISLLISVFTYNKNVQLDQSNKQIYLKTNGVHLDIVIPIIYLDSLFLSDLEYESNAQFIAFGWGDENFYLNTPRWKDLKLKHAFQALFLRSNTLMHITPYNNANSNWVAIKLGEEELIKIQAHIHNSFFMIENKKQMIDGASYGQDDRFYKANGHYTCFNTCNTWVNSVFKSARMKACYWTPFDFSLINKYK